MKKFLLFIFLTCLFQHAYSQKPKTIAVTNTSIVKDSSGEVYSKDVWEKLMLTGYYTMRAETPGDENTAFILVRLSEAEKERKLSAAPKPMESKSFKTGEAIKNFSTTDITGKKYKLKDLKGKIVVLNFWFINCPPCRAEIFELNKIVEEYKDSSNIVFLAIALDKKSELTDFLKRSPFDYTIIDDGRFIATQYDVTAYPTHVVINPEGIVTFHTIGTGSTVIHWIRKSIKELMKTENSNK